MDSEVGRTLAELERKLHELERALSAEPGRSRPASEATSQPPSYEASQPPSQSQEAPRAASVPHPAPPASGARLVDEELPERDAPLHAPLHAPPEPSEEDDRRRASPPVESATPPVESAAPPVESAAPPVESAAPPVESIELGELLRFRDKLASTLRDLVDDYSEIITLRKASPDRAPERDSEDDAP